MSKRLTVLSMLSLLSMRHLTHGWWNLQNRITLLSVVANGGELGHPLSASPTGPPKKANFLTFLLILRQKWWKTATKMNKTLNLSVFTHNKRFQCCFRPEMPQKSYPSWPPLSPKFGWPPVEGDLGHHCWLVSTWRKCSFTRSKT